MIRFICWRTLQAIPVLLVVVTVTFFLVRAAPGGPFDDERRVSPQIEQRLLAHYQLDQPIFEQYLSYLSNLLRGDLGPSFRYPGRRVNEILLQGMPETVELAGYALLFSLILGIGAGLIAARRPNSSQDRITMAVAMIGICMPSFLLGPLLVLVFGIYLDWLPVAGWGRLPGDKVLPTITLGAAYTAYIARLCRGSLLEVMSADFVRTARATGLSESAVLRRHALRGALLPVAAFLGPAMAGLLSGSFVVETVFQIPGIGRFYIQGAFNRDYTLVMGMTIFFATLLVLLNLLSDILSAWLDPRICMDRRQ